MSVLTLLGMLLGLLQVLPFAASIAIPLTYLKSKDILIRALPVSPPSPCCKKTHNFVYQFSENLVDLYL